MYRLLILDDEPYIVDWIFEMFQQQSDLDLDLYKAYTAADALDILARAKIDIVMTDIKMPDMDGLQLFSVIRDSWPRCKVIFLTSYSEFEYAHIANKGGVRYLLKTESDSEIIKTVRLCIDELDRADIQSQILQKAQKQLEQTLPILQREFFQEILRANTPNEITQDNFQQLAIRLDARKDILLMIGRFDNWFQAKRLKGRAQQTLLLQAFADELLSPVLDIACFEYDQAVLVWIMQPRLSQSQLQPADWQRMTGFVKGVLDSLQESCRRNLNTTVSFSIYSEALSWDKLPKVFAKLLTRLNVEGLGNNGIVLSTAAQSASHPDVLDFQAAGLQLVNSLLEKARSLGTYLESGQHEAFFGILSALRKELPDLLPRYPYLDKQVIYTITLLLLSYINQSMLIFEKITAQAELSKLLDRQDNRSLEEMFDIFETIGHEIFNHQTNSKDKREKSIITAINEFIKKNMDKDLSLIRLAEIVNLNPSYLSRLYKQLTGVNVTDTILDVRISRAKRLLKESNLKVHDIAAKVGFDSDAYFIRSFKKKCGMTPQEYREHN